jgi:hypothetical protein
MDPPESRITKSLLRFGQFTLDLERHALYRGQEPIHLTVKPFETLVFPGTEPWTNGQKGYASRCRPPWNDWFSKDGPELDSNPGHFNRSSIPLKKIRFPSLDRLYHALRGYTVAKQNGWQPAPSTLVFSNASDLPRWQPDGKRTVCSESRQAVEPSTTLGAKIGLGPDDSYVARFDHSGGLRAGMAGP